MVQSKALRPSSAPYDVYPLADVLRRASARWSEREAVIDGPRRFSFAQLDQQSDSFASVLASLGVKKGDRVALFAPNAAEFIVAFYGIIKAGAVATTVNAAYRERELAYQLNDAGAAVLVAHQAMLPVVREARGTISGLKTLIVIGEPSAGALSFHRIIEDHKEPPPRVDIAPTEDLAALPYSSGTTGLPKGVMLTHFNLTTNVKQFLDTGSEGVAPTPDDVVLVHLPLFHIYGMTVLMNGCLAAGAKQVLMPRFDMEGCLRLIAEHRVSVIFTVPPVVLGFTLHPAVPKSDLSSVRVCVSGAAPLSADLQSRMEDLTGIPTINAYGLTETSPVTNCDFLDPARRRRGSIGPAIPDTEEKVVDLESGLRELPRGEVGELVIRGRQVMKGYWKNPEANAETLRNGWLHTGDMANMDQDGYVYIVDRKKELIKYKGFQVPPAELEGLLLEHAAIADVAVVGKPDEEAGEVPKAYVVAKSPDLSAEEVMAFVEGRVAGFKQIREVEFVEQIPRSPTGKILRRVLIERERQRAQT